MIQRSPLPDLTPVAGDSDAELAVIGAVILHGPDALDHLDGFDPDDCSPTHATILHTALGIAREGHRPDTTLLANAIDPTTVDHRALAVLVMDALDRAPVLASVAKYAQVVADLARARRIQAAALDLAQNPANGHATQLLDRLNTLHAGTRPGGLTMTPAATITIARPHWIWDQRIPVGGVTLLAGREGHGKTLLACWLAARLTQGQLQGEHHGTPTDVIYIGLEDDRSTIIAPRLVAAGADLTRFHFVDIPNDTFALDRHLTNLADATRHMNVGLIIIDPLDAHLGHVDTHKKGEVQATVGQFSELTQHLRCGALGLAHFNKNTGLKDLLARINGSRGFSSAVRSVLGVGPHPHDDNDRLCLLAKANNTSITDVPAIRYRIEPAQIDNPTNTNDPIPTAAVAIIAHETGHHPDNLLDPTPPEDRTQLDDAIDWLHSLLQHQPQPRADIQRLAKAEGITDKTLRTARERLGVHIDRDDRARGRPSMWRLPDTQPAPDEPP